MTRELPRRASTHQRDDDSIGQSEIEQHCKPALAAILAVVPLDAGCREC